MSQTYSTTVHLHDEQYKPIFFTSWFIVDRKWTALLLLAFAAGIGLFAWQSFGVFSYGLGVFLILMLSLGRMFLPCRFEVNSDGILCNTLGKKRFIAWEDIRVYQIRNHGLLLLPHRDRFLLEAFRGFFLPVPASLRTEVLYRFRVFVDRISS